MLGDLKKKSIVVPPFAGKIRAARLRTATASKVCSELRELMGCARASGPWIFRTNCMMKYCRCRRYAASSGYPSHRPSANVILWELMLLLHREWNRRLQKQMHHGYLRSSLGMYLFCQLIVIWKQRADKMRHLNCRKMFAVEIISPVPGERVIDVFSYNVSGMWRICMHIEIAAFKGTGHNAKLNIINLVQKKKIGKRRQIYCSRSRSRVVFNADDTLRQPLRAQFPCINIVRVGE